MKKKASRRLVAAFTMAAMLVTLMPSGAAFAAPAEAAGEAVQATQATAAAKTAPKEVAGDTQEAGENQYVSYEWDYDQEQLIRTVKEIPRYATVVTQDNINDVWSNGMIQGGTYVIEGDVTVNGLLIVDGSVDIILKDRSQLNAIQGIHLENGAGLDIFAQSEKSWNMGKLFANSAEKDGYGIGGNDAGYINIFGGFVKATGVNSPGLGARAIRIIGGDITAKSNHEAAIGSVDYGLGAENRFVGIYGGTVTAKSDYEAAIGGGADIQIYGGKVDATNTYNSGIGGTSAAYSIDIYGGEVNAQGSLGIGRQNGGQINLFGGTINATGGDTAIGHADSIQITGGEVTAIGSRSDGYSSGIGYVRGNLNILGGNVILKNNQGIHAAEVAISGGTIEEVGSSSANIISSTVEFMKRSDKAPKSVIDIGGDIRGDAVQIRNADIDCRSLEYNHPEVLIRESNVCCTDDSYSVGQISGHGRLGIVNSRVNASINVSGDVGIDHSNVDGRISANRSEPGTGNINIDKSFVFGDIDADNKRVTLINNSVFSSGAHYEGDITCGDLVIKSSKVGLGNMIHHSKINAQNIDITDGFVEAHDINGKLRINEGNSSNTSRSIVYADNLLDHSNETHWNGLVIDGGAEGRSIGKVYGPHVISNNYKRASDTIIVPKGATLTIPSGVTLDISDGFVINEGTIDGDGTLGDSTSYLSGTGTVESTINNKLKTQGEIRLTPSHESVAEGQYLTLDVKATKMPTGLKDFYVKFYRGNTLLCEVPMNVDGTAKSDAITVRKGNGWVIGKMYPISAQVYGCYDEYASDGTVYRSVPVLLGQGTCKINVVKSGQAAPAAPSKKAVSDTSVTLNTIAKSANGAMVLYGMKVTDGSFTWKTEPFFDNLKPDTDYIFAAKYDAVGNFAESPMSQEVTIRTASLSPVISTSTGGKTTVTVTNPKPGDIVGIVPAPDNGYEVDQVKVIDEKGKVIEVTKEANGQYQFVQPDTRVTITVTYKKVAPPTPPTPPAPQPQKPQKPETSQGDSWNNPFTDVPKGAWYNDAVRYVYENGLMVGLAPNNFGANVTTDRGQLVTMLWRMAGEPQATNGADFSDVPSNAYYANAVAWAAENGITSGFEDGTFRPQTGLSREQMAALFMKYAEATGVDTSVRADISSYTDINPNSWSYDALSWAKAVGLLSGVSDTTMAPQATATRAQIAAVLQRYCETVAK